MMAKALVLWVIGFLSTLFQAEKQTFYFLPVLGRWASNLHLVGMAALQVIKIQY